VHARSRDDGRTAIAWDASANGGFTTGEPWLALTGNYDTINAAAEIDDPESVRSYYKRLISIRKAEPVIALGDVSFLDTASDKVIAYQRTLGDARVVVECNFSGQEQQALDTAGSEVLISNYSEPAWKLRPWEAVAHIWR
jgi:trehalose-6-phosphate hydrolase